jgi:activating signal cointegrator 1
MNNKQNQEDQSSRTGTKKKTKFYNFYGKDGQTNDVVMLKGRVKCDCQATKHELVNNCLNCGRIVCKQEGSGNCLFCGNLVCSEEEQRLINSQSKKGENLKKTLMENKKVKKGLEDAIQQRDRLIRYDREAEKRTTVIDDESDYFKANSVWLSDEERKKLKVLEEELKEKMHSSRANKKMTFDFAGRQVIEESSKIDELEKRILKEIIDVTESNNQYTSQIDPEMLKHAPIFIEISDNQGNKKSHSNGFDGVYNRVQDKEFQEMSDLRCCLSMHQPYASLLISGIKRHEGRCWYTAHRGRLWIASTAKTAEQEEINQLEGFYKQIYNDENIEFPLNYPQAVLLGCVIVTNCLPQEEYRKIYPEGESDSPFVMICEDPQELSIRFPIKGDHKICKLKY